MCDDPVCPLCKGWVQTVSGYVPNDRPPDIKGILDALGRISQQLDTLTRQTRGMYDSPFPRTPGNPMPCGTGLDPITITYNT